MAGTLIFLGASAAAAAAGAAFAIAWKVFFPPGVQSRFWAQLSALTQDLLVVDEASEFLGVYRRLGAALGGYLARNLAITAIGVGALTAAVFFALVPLSKAWDAAGGVLTASRPEVARTAVRNNEGVVYSVDGKPITVKAAPGEARLAICGSGASCLALELLGYQIVEQPSSKRPVVIRWSHGDRNPLWPYLSDLEAMFALVFMLSMTVGMLWPGKRRRADDGLFLKQADFALVQLNEFFKPLVRAIGDFETRLAKRSLPQHIQAPIFITGLARSGTTTVLNALTHSPELGSHQYRDFPFLGAPLLWSRLQGAIAKDVEPVERPHKDRIRITKVSPEAYEEPLWQQFFPGIHDPGRNQRLTAKASNPKFERFFEDHLRKILKLRGAPRYVSKGNYNVGRIEYLARLFPDARFIVPVREPMSHVASLVRQHALFNRYADTDPRVPHYLRAAGHYEFGPQRRAIALSRQAAAGAKQVWSDGDAIGYARQWAEVYGHVLQLLETPLRDRIQVVRYEELCAEPAKVLQTIVDRCGLADADGGIAAFARQISESDAQIPAEVEAQRAEILAAVRSVAEALGYGAALPSAPRALATS